MVSQGKITGANVEYFLQDLNDASHCFKKHFVNKDAATDPALTFNLFIFLSANIHSSLSKTDVLFFCCCFLAMWRLRAGCTGYCSC